MNGSVLFEGSPLLSGTLNVNTGGNIEPLNVEINENGTRTITPPSGVDGYAPITIETVVPQIMPILETLNVTQNGRYEPPEGVAGFDEVNVEVLHPLETLSVTENGSYEPPTGVYGFSHVNVNVPTQTPKLESLNITQNGTYTPPSGVDGYDEINVNVPTFPYYKYISAVNGKIVVRQCIDKVNGEITITTLWFFNGYEKPSTDVDIPSELIPYIPFFKTDTASQTSAYSDETSDTQIGWIGFLYPSNPNNRKLRSWNPSTASLMGGTFWGVYDINGATQQTRKWFDPYDV